ncbi:hypothetical protein CERSUDRAFT_108953 [Gelatoporia subvermispora B]|uniref:Protein-S-isoprenylcysteine O-methyltransferase n=1 Tax=Ceriporiopsis subvermispora (strain B) TaxID=914234 RepID=M2R0A3_CERS8|nr:hypothetical protein CERSUDRAFT_108953 [Gelatoporia subvermispora B]
MSYLKIPLILSAALANHIALTSPQSPASARELAKGMSPAQRIFRIAMSTVAPIAKFVVWIACFCEVATILAYHNLASVAAQRTLSALSWTAEQNAVQINISPIFLIGWILSISGGLVRLSCYHTLGRFFTYEVAVRPAHQLITAGPYAWVRHPSYISGMIETVGIAMCLFSSGSWILESGVLGTEWGRVLAYSWWTWNVYLIGGVFNRIPQEDQVLRTEFGKQWDDWAKAVPYRLVPSLY